MQMPAAIFYDLETSDKHTIGQILNYSFITVDKNFEIISECNGLIRLSRLQLPDPEAILANRVDVIEHQAIAKDCEYVAVKKIASYIAKQCEECSQSIPLIGYNSSRFDLPYLRTTFIRNGINPYFGGRVAPRDLLHAVQKSYISSPDFAALMRERRDDSDIKLSLSLENVSRRLGLLDGKQEHESRADVIISIALARCLHEKYRVDVKTLEAYEAKRLHPTCGSGSVYLRLEPNYDLMDDEPVRRTPVTLLSCDHRSSLWVDLRRFGEKFNRSSVGWHNLARSSFFTDCRSVDSREFSGLARKAIETFKGLTISNFFTTSVCDIELDIYRIDFDALDALGRAIESGSSKAIPNAASKDLKILWTRYRLAHENLNLSDSKVSALLGDYVRHRYCGKLLISKQEESTESFEPLYHPTFDEMIKKIDELVAKRIEAESEEDIQDLKLLRSLKSFYLASEIARILGGANKLGGREASIPKKVILNRTSSAENVSSPESSTASILPGSRSL